MSAEKKIVNQGSPHRQTDREVFSVMQSCMHTEDHYSSQSRYCINQSDIRQCRGRNFPLKQVRESSFGMNHDLWICFIFLFLLSLSIPCLIKRLCILQVCFISVGKLDFVTHLCKAFCALKTSLLHFFSVELYLQASTNFYINKAKSIYHSSLIQRTLEVGSTEKWLQKIELLRKRSTACCKWRCFSLLH